MVNWRSFNEHVAVRVTLAAFTMEAVYLCVLLSLLPLIEPGWMEDVLFISNAVQLTLLSVVGVGTLVLNRASEQRASEDHAALMEELADMRMLMTEEDEELLLLRAIAKKVGAV